MSVQIKNLDMENKIQIFDNFLEKKDFNNLKQFMLSGESDFQWYFSPDKVTDGDGMPQFCHVFYENCNVNTDKFQYIEPLVKKIDPLAIVRIKSNITMKTSAMLTSPLHHDSNPNTFDNRDNITLDNQRTGVFYLNTNNGYTYFESGERVDSVENRLLVFPSSKRHAGTTNTDVDYRCVINLNWF